MSSSSPENPSSHDSQEFAFATWMSLIYRHVDLEECCAAITNETKLWSGWDRVSLVVQEDSQHVVKSISGAEAIDPRSNTAKLFEDLSQRFSNGDSHVVSRIEQPIEGCQQYHERCLVKTVAIFPLHDPRGASNSQSIGVLICDLFGEQSEQSFRKPEDLAVAARQIQQALSNSLQFERAKSNRWMRAIRSRRLLKVSVMLGILALVGLVLLVVPADLTISGTGVLRPERQQDLFAGSDGLIEEVHVGTGSMVTRGDAIISLRSPELDLKMSELTGQLQTIRQQISDLEKLRTDPRRSSTLQESGNELAAPREELKSVESGLLEQLKLLKLRLEELKLTSPLDGTVITTDVDQLLTKKRPVRRADRLLRIADLSGPWLIELMVDQPDIGPVVDAIEKQLELTTFVTADAPGISKSTDIDTIAPNLTTDSTLGAALVVEGHVERDSIPDARPGQKVSYLVRCGRAPLGYVLFRRLVDRVRSWWLLTWG